MKGYSLCTFLVILGGCHAVEKLYINGSKRFITDGVSTDNIKDGLSVAESLINQIDTDDFNAVMKNAVSAASKYLGILNPLLGLVFSLFGSGPSEELQAIKHLFNTMQHRFDIVDQKFAQLHRAISFVPTQVSLNAIEGSITALKKEYGYLSSATSAHGYNSQKQAFIHTYDRSYHDAGTKLYHSIMSGTVANRHTGLFQEYANFTVYDRKQVQNFMLGAFGLLFQASALEITYASLRHYSNFAHRVRDWNTQIRNVVNKMKEVDDDIRNNYHVYSGNDIWHDDTIYSGVHTSQDVANNLYNKLIRKVCPFLKGIICQWHSLEMNIYVRKGAKIRNRYKQVPHLTQDTNGKVTNSQLYTTNESQEVSPFPAGDHKTQINRRSQRHNKQKTEKNIKYPRRSTALERSVKYFTGGLKPVSRRQPHP